MGFRFIDLFAGIGGFHVAIEALGGECVFASEIDPDCQDVYERNFKMRPEGDIRPLTEGKRVLVPEHDLLCGGFPCQPFSKSGFQLGMNETRGTLFFNILRILEARRPKHFILENVRNLAGPRQKETWDTIIQNLWRLGYRVACEPAVFSPHLLPPKQGGRPQVRERVFLLGTYVGEAKHPEDLDEQPRLRNAPADGWNKERWRIEDWLQPESEVEHPERYALRPEEVAWIEAWDDFVKVIPEEPLPGFPIWVDAFKPKPRIGKGDPDWKADFLTKNSAFYVRNRKAIDAWLSRHPIQDFPLSRRKFEWQARGYDRDLWKLVLHLRPSGIRVKGPTYLPALVAITQTSIIGSRRRRITPREAARLQGFPDSFLLHEDDKAAYKQLGNAVNVGAVQHAWRALHRDEATSARRTREKQMGFAFGERTAEPRTLAQ